MKLATIIMSVYSGVNKMMRILVILSFIFSLEILVSDKAMAQDNLVESQGLIAKSSKRKRTKRKRSTRKSSNKRATKRTVGDYLGRIQELGQKSKVKKRKTSIPTAKQFLQVRKVKRVQSIQPPRSYTFFEKQSPEERQLEKLVDAEIKQLFKLARRHSKSKARGEIWLRLAELYVEKAKFVEFNLLDRFDRKHEAWVKKGRKGREPSLNLKPAREFNKKAIKLYEWYLADFPKGKKADQATFFLGYNHFEINKLKEGADFYKSLTKKFKGSPFITESHFALGEFYFENDQWQNALNNYLKVIKDRRARMYVYSHYKAAWALYKVGKPKTSMQYFEKLIRLTQKSEKGKVGVRNARLAQEALKDMISPYAESRDYKDAYSYFSRLVGGDESAKVVEKLAYYYSDKGARSKARYLFKFLIRRDPDGPKAFEHQYQIVQDFSAAGARKIYLAELFNWIDYFRVGGSWWEANRENKEVVEKAEKLTEATLRNYTLSRHQDFQNSKSGVARKASEEGYKSYLKYFPKHEKAGEMRFYYAELLFDSEKYRGSVAQYQWIVKNDPKNKFAAQASLNSVLALEKLLPDTSKLYKTIEQDPNPRPFGSDEQRFVQVSMDYVVLHPKGEKVVEIQFKVGRLHYIYRHFDEAIKIFTHIVNKYPNDKLSALAANLTLDIYNIRKDYLGLAKVGREFLNNPKLKGKGLAADIRKVVEQASFKSGEELEKGKKYIEAANSYKGFYDSNKRSPLALGAAFNAGINFERAGKIAPALSMYKVVLGGKGKDDKRLKKESLRLLGRLYERTGQYERAAIEFENYAKNYPGDTLSTSLHLNAAVIWGGLKRYTRSIRNYNKYFDRARGSQKNEALKQIAELEESRRRFSSAIIYYEKYINGNPRDYYNIVESYFKIADLSRRIRRTTAAKKWHEKTIAVQRRLSSRKANVGANFAAQSRLYLMQDDIRAYYRLKIPRNPKKMASVVQSKLAALDRLNKQFARVIKYDDGPTIVASLAQLGAAYDNLVVAVENAPIPKELKPDQVAQYKAGVEDQIIKPIRSKAVENLRSAVDRAIKLSAFDESLTLVRRILRKYDNSIRYVDPKMVRPVAIPDMMGI